jgi:hypothetical protein
MYISGALNLTRRRLYYVRTRPNPTSRGQLTLGGSEKLQHLSYLAATGYELQILSPVAAHNFTGEKYAQVVRSAAETGHWRCAARRNLVGLTKKARGRVRLLYESNVGHAFERVGHTLGSLSGRDDDWQCRAHRSHFVDERVTLLIGQPHVDDGRINAAGDEGQLVHCFRCRAGRIDIEAGLFKIVASKNLDHHLVASGLAFDRGGISL